MSPTPCRAPFSRVFAGRTLLAVTGAAVVIACGGAARSSGPGSSFAVGACPTAESATRRDTATVTVALTVDPAPRDSAEAVVRIEGETERNDLRVNPAVPLTLRLPRGVYDVRVTMPGYGGAGGRMTLSGGCEVEMKVGLRRR